MTLLTEALDGLLQRRHILFNFKVLLILHGSSCI